MGCWFTNFHIRKKEGITETSVLTYLGELLTAQHYLPTLSEDGADAAFAVVTGEDARWFSVYADGFLPEGLDDFADYATPMSRELETDVLGIACFDSDALCLNLIDATGAVNAWARIGRAAELGILRRTNLSAWKAKVENYPKFRACLQKQYLFAEAALDEIAPCLGLPQLHAKAGYADLEPLGLREKATFLYFRLPETAQAPQAPKLVQGIQSLMPCFLEKPAAVTAINVGGASEGLSVYFIGPYVEQEEITFSDVCFVKSKGHQTELVPFSPEKVQLPDGQWAYYHHDPSFRIPPKADDRLPPVKRMRSETENSIVVRFIPHGNPRKLLDIAVVFVPDKNPEGQTGWKVWQRYGTKQAFIAFHNQIWSKYPDCKDLLLREGDYD